MEKASSSFLRVFCSLTVGTSDLDGSYRDVCVTTDFPITFGSSL